MHFKHLRTLDKIMMPVAFRLYPVERLIQGLRVLFNAFYNKYLKVNSKGSPPDVLYRSNNYLIINKPWDVKINSDNSEEYTVATNLTDHFPQLSDDTLSHRFRFNHRLDYPTSGVLSLSLNKKAAAKFSKLFLKRSIRKHYLALVGGYLSEPYILVDIPIGKDSFVDYKHKQCACTSEGCVDSKHAMTLTILLEYGTYNGMPASKVLMIPYTGRTHQLRVHSNLIGHTIIGDYTYSNEKDTAPYRMMLHAYRMIVPLHGEPLDIVSPDPFLTSVDPKWKPHKVITNYDDVMKENLTLKNVKEKNISSLTYHTMKIYNSQFEKNPLKEFSSYLSIFSLYINFGMDFTYATLYYCMDRYD
ncbi:RNA pseudouridylate synthase domain-containing protein 1 [Mytilus edulis]|uniref:RNA pseudouridylate synthase domain-containing protein 1 n=1 Tax=Mytilus edulis TaxID=6550 RepID=A0A8S3VCY1_MYTED|nr:RNA pseudouridylate synthase domain-containing protein 1 [Mytilus edulis]